MSLGTKLIICILKSPINICARVCVCVWGGGGGGGGGGEGEVFHITHSLANWSGHTATIELSPRQKLDLTNQICALRRLHPLSWSTIRHVFSRCQHLVT